MLELLKHQLTSLLSGVHKPTASWGTLASGVLTARAESPGVPLTPSLTFVKGSWVVWCGVLVISASSTEVHGAGLTVRGVWFCLQVWLWCARSLASLPGLAFTGIHCTWVRKIFGWGSRVSPVQGECIKYYWNKQNVISSSTVKPGMRGTKKGIP